MLGFAFAVKEERMSVTDFMNGKEWGSSKKAKKEKKKVKQMDHAKAIGLAGGLATMSTMVPFSIPLGGVPHAMAQTAIPAMTQPVLGGVVTGAAAGKIITAFAPLIQLLTDIAFPIASISITVGCLLMMAPSMREKATSMMMNAVIGFFLVQMVPIFMTVLAEIAKAM